MWAFRRELPIIKVRRCCHEFPGIPGTLETQVLVARQDMAWWSVFFLLGLEALAQVRRARNTRFSGVPAAALFCTIVRGDEDEPGGTWMCGCGGCWWLLVVVVVRVVAVLLGSGYDGTSTKSPGQALDVSWLPADPDGPLPMSKGSKRPSISPDTTLPELSRPVQNIGISSASFASYLKKVGVSPLE